MGRKVDELYNAMQGRGCLGRSQDEEPVFVLVARDQLAPAVVRQWAMLAKSIGVPAEKVDEANQLADQMEAWQQRCGMKVPD